MTRNDRTVPWDTAHRRRNHRPNGPTIGHVLTIGPDQSGGADQEQIPELAEELLESGFSEMEAASILGEKHLRAAERVWR